MSLSLVNGQPDSFLFPLAAPRYLRRSLVHPDDPDGLAHALQRLAVDHARGPLAQEDWDAWGAMEGKTCCC